MKYLLFVFLLPSVLACSYDKNQAFEKEYASLIVKNVIQAQQLNLSSSKDKLEFFRSVYSDPSSCKKTVKTSQEAMNILLMISTGNYLDPTHKNLALCLGSKIDLLKEEEYQFYFSSLTSNAGMTVYKSMFNTLIDDPIPFFKGGFGLLEEAIISNRADITNFLLDQGIELNPKIWTKDLFEQFLEDYPRKFDKETLNRIKKHASTLITK